MKKKIKVIPLSKGQSKIFGKIYPITIQYPWIYLQIHISNNNGILFLALIPYKYQEYSLDITQKNPHIFRVVKDNLDEGISLIMGNIIQFIEMNDPDKIKLLFSDDNEI